jgi:hypothetical protein
VPARDQIAGTSADKLKPAPLRVRFRPEPAYSLFGRLAARNLETSCRAYARRHGLRFDVDIVGGHATAEVAKLAGLPEPLVASNTSRRLGVRWDEFKGEHLASGMWWRGRTYCPACLADDLKVPDGPEESRPFRRAWWDIRLFRNCPVHCLQLASVCPACRKPLDIDNPVPWRCRCGETLTTTPTQQVDAVDCTFERYLLGRLGGAELKPIPVLDRLPLMGVEEATYQMGRMLDDEISNPARWYSTRRASLRSVGTAALSSSVDALLHMLGGLARSRHAPTLASLIPVIRESLPTERKPEIQELESVVRRRPTGLGQSWIKKPLSDRRPGRAPAARPDPQPFDPAGKEILTVKEAAMFCGMRVQLFRMAAYAGLIRVHGHGPTARVRTEDCRTFAARYATAAQLAREHGRRTQGLRGLLKTAGIAPLAVMLSGGFVFSREEASEFLASAEAPDHRQRKRPTKRPRPD